MPCGAICGSPSPGIAAGQSAHPVLRLATNIKKVYRSIRKRVSQVATPPVGMKATASIRTPLGTNSFEIARR
jgi:hypothetical protein